jgi:hypothetical protein
MRTPTCRVFMSRRTTLRPGAWYPTQAIELQAANRDSQPVTSPPKYAYSHPRFAPLGCALSRMQAIQQARERAVPAAYRVDV